MLAVDQLLYDLAKKMQWTFLDLLGEDKFVVILVGLHLEMALWSTMGDLLRGSGWPEALKEAWLVKTEAAATAILKASHVMRTRYVHQVTIVVLDNLLRQAYEHSGSNKVFDGRRSFSVKSNVPFLATSTQVPTNHIYVYPGTP